MAYDPIEPYDPAAWARELDAPAAPPRSADQNTGLLSDYGTDIKRGLLQLPGAATGLADMLVQGAIGAPRAVLEGASALTGDATYHQASQALNQPWVSKAAGALGEFTGVEPGKWADEAQQEYSPERQAAQAEVERAWEEGGAGNIAGAYLRNPAHTIGGAIAESLPATLAGGFLGRGIAALGQVPRAMAAAPTLSKYLSPTVAFGAGEGAVAAGMNMAQAADQGAPADVATATSLGVLGTTGALGVLGGRLANRLGIGDVEQALAGATRGEAATAGLAGRLAEAAVQPTLAGRATRVGFGAVSEGLIEEAPQSALEQVWQNVATGQDLTANVTRSAVEGALAGAGMGGGFNAFTSGRQPPAETPPATGAGVVPPPPATTATAGAVPPALTPAPGVDLTNPIPPTPPGATQDGQKANAVPTQEDLLQGQNDEDRQEGGRDGNVQGQADALQEGGQGLLTPAVARDGNNLLWENTVVGVVDPETGALTGGTVLWSKLAAKARKDPTLNTEKIEGAKGAERVIGVYDAASDTWLGQAPTTPEVKPNAVPVPVPRDAEADTGVPGAPPVSAGAGEAPAVATGTIPTAEELVTNAIQETTPGIRPTVPATGEQAVEAGSAGPGSPGSINRPEEIGRSEVQQAGATGPQEVTLPKTDDELATAIRSRIGAAVSENKMRSVDTYVLDAIAAWAHGKIENGVYAPRNVRRGGKEGGKARGSQRVYVPDPEAPATLSDAEFDAELRKNAPEGVKIPSIETLRKLRVAATNVSATERAALSANYAARVSAQRVENADTAEDAPLSEITPELGATRNDTGDRGAADQVVENANASKPTYGTQGVKGYIKAMTPEASAAAEEHNKALDARRVLIAKTSWESAREKINSILGFNSVASWEELSGDVQDKVKNEAIAAEDENGVTTEAAANNLTRHVLGIAKANRQAPPADATAAANAIKRAAAAAQKQPMAEPEPGEEGEPATKKRRTVTPEGQPSEGTPSLRSTTLGAAQAVVDKLVGNNPAAKRRIVLVENSLDERVPIQAFSADIAASQQGKVIHGWIQTVNGQQTIYLFYGNTPLSALPAVLMHELTHASDATMRRFAGRIKKFAASDTDSTERRIARAALQRVAAANPARESVDSEIIAYFVEEAVRAGIDPVTGAGATPQTRSLLREMWRWVQGMLRKLGVYSTSHMTAGDIVSLVHSLAQTATFDLEKHGAARAVVDGKTQGTPVVEASPEAFAEAGIPHAFGVFVPGENGAPGTAYVRNDLPPAVKRFVASHELHHAKQGREYIAAHPFLAEIGANLFPGFRDPIGLAATIAMSLTPERLRFYAERVGALKPTSQGQASVEAPTLATDLDAQSKFLTQRAAQAGYADLNDMLFKDPDAFFDLAAEWSDGHPREDAGGQMLFSVGPNQAPVQLSPSAQLASNWWEASKDWTKEYTRRFWQQHGFALYTDSQLNERHGTEGSRKVAEIKDAITFDATTGIQEDARLDNRWVQLPKVQADLVSQVLHEGRRLGFNPANPDADPMIGSAEYKLQAAWRRLTPEAKAIHKDVLAYYKNSLLAKKAVLENVRDQVRAANKGAKSDEIDMVLKTFENAIASAEEAAEDGTYTPFIRVGDFHVIGMSPEMAALEAHHEASQKDPVNHAWTAADTKRRNALRQDPNHYVVQGATSVADMQKKHRALALKFGKFGVQSMQNKVHSSMLSTADLTAISKYRATLENTLVQDAQGNTRSAMDPAAIDAAVFALQRMMIELLPEGHQLKRTLKVELIPGEEPDARAVFAQVARSDAHYMARLKHANELSEAMAEMQRVGNTIPPANAPSLTDDERTKILQDAEDARAVSNEFMKRANQTMSEPSPTANWLLNWSFFDHLGGSAAFLLMNAHQPWTVTLPVLAARLGGTSQAANLKKTGEALWRHSKAAAKMLTFTKTGTAGQLATAQAEARVAIDTAALLAEAAKIQDPTERAKREQQIHFLEHLTRVQLLDITLEHNLGTSADTRLQTLGRAIRTISMPVQAGEMINRAASGLAAFELGLEKFNGDVAQATKFAESIVRDTQIDYSAGHTARAMRSVLGSQPLARIVFQFWKYRQGMLFLTFASAKDAFFDASKSDAEKQVARRTLAGLYATTMLTAGIFEGPLIAGGLGALSMLAGLGGDDDDPPVDFQQNIRNMMADIDPVLAEIASKGIWALAGIDMSKRLGQGDLANPLAFARFTGKSGRDDAATALSAAAGAPFATLADTWDGVTKIARGDVREGIQQIVPLKGAADLMRAWGLGTEGLTTQAGEQIKGPGAFSAADVLARAGGAQPLAMSRYYEGNAAVQAAKKAADEGRKKVIAEYAQARRRGQPSAEAMQAVREYNSRHPEKGYRITTETLLKAVRERAKIEKQRGDTGVLRSPQNKPFLPYGRFAEVD